MDQKIIFLLRKHLSIINKTLIGFQTTKKLWKNGFLFQQKDIKK